jgi:hypothetical protein
LQDGLRTPAQASDFSGFLLLDFAGVGCYGLRQAALIANQGIGAEYLRGIG